MSSCNLLYNDNKAALPLPLLSIHLFCVLVFTSGSSKNPPQERKATPTPREMSATKSPLPGVPDQQTYERLLQGLGAADVYRQIPLAFDPAALPRGIPIDSGTATVRLYQSVFSLSSESLTPRTHILHLCLRRLRRLVCG